MKKTTEIHFIRTYNIAQWLRDEVIENDPFEHLLDFFEPDEEFIKRALKPQKESLLHRFIEEKIELGFEYESRKFPDFNEWNRMTTKYIELKLSEKKFESDDEYPYEVADIITEQVLPKIGAEVFYLLFGDREFLFYFNDLISKKITTLSQSDYPEFLKKDGVVKRVSYWSKWLQRAIFYRDKGMCNYCYRDVSGLLNLNNKINLDHIIPLDLGGTNDTTNIQLLCEKCNNEKRAKRRKGKYYYMKYY